MLEKILILLQLMGTIPLIQKVKILIPLVYIGKKKKKKEASETNSLTFSSLEPQALY